MVTTNSVPGSGVTKPWVVVVDDDEGCLVEIRRVLGADYRLSSFESPAVALDAIKKFGCPDLVITDQRMPGMLGTEFLEQLVALHPESVGIIISGFTARHDLVSAINKARVFAYVSKPWRGQYLKETIDRAVILARGRRATVSLGDDIGALSTVLSEVSMVVPAGNDSVHETLAKVRRQLSELADRSNTLASKSLAGGIDTAKKY